jgi:hypothetical protein
MRKQFSGPITCWMNLMIRGNYLNKTPNHLDNMLYYIILIILYDTAYAVSCRSCLGKGTSVHSTTDYYAISWFTPKLMLMKIALPTRTFGESLSCQIAIKSARKFRYWYTGHRYKRCFHIMLPSLLCKERLQISRFM